MLFFFLLEALERTSSSCALVIGHDTDNRVIEVSLIVVVEPCSAFSSSH